MGRITRSIYLGCWSTSRKRTKDNRLRLEFLYKFFKSLAKPTVNGSRYPAQKKHLVFPYWNCDSHQARSSQPGYCHIGLTDELHVYLE